MLPRGSVFRELRGYLPGPLPANKWSRRPTMMNCEFGSSPVCLQLPASVPASIESVMLNQLKVTVSYRHPRRRGVPRGVHRRRGGGYHRVGGPGRGRGVGDPPLRSPPSGSGWGEGGGETPLLVSCTKYPSWRICSKELPGITRALGGCQWVGASTRGWACAHRFLRLRVGRAR